MEKEGRRLTIWIIIVILILAGFFTIKSLKLFSNYDTFFCAGKDFQEINRYADPEKAKSNSFTFNHGQCKDDCSTFCPTINMKYYNSKAVRNFQNGEPLCESIKNNQYNGEPDFDPYSCSCKCV